MGNDMTIEEAIKHAEEVASRKCDECGKQHQQLADWLKELVTVREKLKIAEDALDKIFNLVFVDCEVAMVAKKALAEIRNKGADDGK